MTTDRKAMIQALATFSGLAICSETHDTRLYDELIDLKTHTMKYNIIVNFDKHAIIYREEDTDFWSCGSNVFTAELNIDTASVESLYILMHTDLDAIQKEYGQGLSSSPSQKNYPL